METFFLIMVPLTAGVCGFVFWLVAVRLGGEPNGDNGESPDG